MLIATIGFNLWLYRLEPTATTDPNDNTFQFALVNRTNTMWDYAESHCGGINKPFCTLSLLTDHWVPNWAEGYNLPYYYSHLPQIAVVGSWRMIHSFAPSVSLFTYYHVVIYLLLCLFPLSVYAALSVLGLSPIAAGVGAFASAHLSTDGLYGLDPSSFLWRGYGLSSQLFAMIWLPLALAYAYRVLVKNERDTRTMLAAISFLSLTTAGHLGVGIMGFLSVGLLAVAPAVVTILAKGWNSTSYKETLRSIGRMLVIFGGTGLLLGYWILPVLRDGNYHNISVWDPIWKFDSYGYRVILKSFFDGDLFDFGRLPILSALTIVGALIAIGTDYAAFALLFAFWLLFYFGRTTWGGMIDLIPGMTEFHISRFIVGLQMTGIFLIPMGVEWLISSTTRIRKFRMLVIPVVIVALAATVIPQTIRYANYNDTLILRGNANYANDKSDMDTLIETLGSLEKSDPGRVYAGRNGWGKEFRIAETPYNMYLSTYGIPVVLWLPETWSPNSDTEQFFREDKPGDYTLYNIRYVVTPPSLPKNQIQPFWKPLKVSKSWILYEVTKDNTASGKESGYITSGVRPAVASVTKTDYLNLVHFWIQSDYPGNGLYPELTFDKEYPKNTGLPNFRMLNEVLYKVPDGSMHDIVSENPVYVSPNGTHAGITVDTQSDDTDMAFRATVTVPADCKECIVVLRQSFHPSWMATVDGKPVGTFTVFPFYVAVQLDSPGTHEVVFAYRPSPSKKLLLGVALLSLIGFCWILLKDMRAKTGTAGRKR